MQLRDLLPWRELTIATSWSPNVAAVELKKRMENTLFDFDGDTPFVGKATSPTEFRFRRRTPFVNSSPPTILVAIEPSNSNGSRVRVRMRLHALLAVFMTLWMTFATVGGVATIVASLRAGSVGGLVGLALPAFGVAIVVIPFRIEARIAEQLLRGIYGAAPARVPPTPKVETGVPYR